MVLIPNNCHVSKGEKDSDFSTMILPMSETSVKIKASLSSFGSIECCLAYELVDQRNESKLLIDFHQVFIAFRVLIMPFKKYKVSAIMFMARKGQFTGSKDDMKRLKEGILRKHLINNEYSFRYTIRDQTLRLKAVFHPGRQASIEVTLEETDKHTDKGPILFK
jgi:hypothetical protein